MVPPLAWPDLIRPTLPTLGLPDSSTGATRRAPQRGQSSTRPNTLADGSAQAALAEVERLLAEQQAATEALRTRRLELERA